MDWNDWILQKNAEFTLDKLGISREEYLEKTVLPHPPRQKVKSDFYERYATAKDPKTDSEVLHSEFNKPQHRQWIAPHVVKNPSTSSKTINHVLSMDDNAEPPVGLSKDNIIGLKYHALRHPNADQGLIDAHVFSPDNVNARMALKRASPEAQMNFVKKYHNDTSKLAVNIIHQAEHMHPSVLEHLANHPDKNIAGQAKYAIRNLKSV